MSTTHAPPAQEPRSAEPELRLFSVDEYFAMVQAGVLGAEERVELLHGRILRMSPIGPRHSAHTSKLIPLFAPLTAQQQALVRVQDTFTLDELSAPQPDLTLVHYREDFYAQQHPTARDALLVVEVAERSLRYDQTTKAAAYALAGIAEYWLIDVAGAQLIRHRQPSASGYAQIQTLRAGQPLAPASFPDLSVDLAWLLA
jgi:Uma2 family endonuclease